MAVAHEEPAPINEVAPDLHPGLSKLIAQLLSKDRDQRPQSATEVVTALTAIERDLEAGYVPAGDVTDENTVTAQPVAAGDTVFEGEPVPVIKAAGDGVGHPPWRKVGLWMWGSFAAILLLGVITFATAKGTVTIIIPDDLPREMKDDVIVNIHGEHDVVEVLDKQNNWSVKLAGGEYTLQVKGGNDQVQLTDKTVTITRFGRRMVHMYYEPNESKAKSSPSADEFWQKQLPADAPAPAIAPFTTKEAKQHQAAWAKFLGVPVKKEIDLSDGVTISFMLIPPGEFKMGEDAGQTATRITRPFYLGTTEVTQGQFTAIMKSTFEVWGKRADSKSGPGFPANWVRWGAVHNFCDNLTSHERQAGRLTAFNHFQLPNEAEWEYACRAGSQDLFSFGSDTRRLEDYAWYAANAAKAGERFPHLVAQKRPNSWGLFDMHGNLKEWCESQYDPDPSKSKLKVVRGGGWYHPAGHCRSGRRESLGTNWATVDTGFRVMLPLDAFNPSPAEPRNFALSFDGVDDFVEIPSLLSPTQTPLTVEVWFTPEKSDGREYLAAVGPFMISRRAEKPMISLFDPPRQNISGGGEEGTLSLGHHTHLAAVWGTNELSIWGDGQLISSWPHEQISDLTSAPAILGGFLHQGKGVECFKGRIDEVRISNVARYQNEFTPAIRFSNDEHTLALYHFDEGKDDVLKDSSGNGNDGKIFGAKWVRGDDELNVIEPSSGGRHGWPADAPPPAIAPFDAAQAKSHQEAWAKYLDIPVEYENSIGMKFRLIPPGEFLMGSTPEEIEAALEVTGENQVLREEIRREAPQHKVVLTQPLYVGVTEVTQAQYEQVMGTNPSHFAGTGEEKEEVANLETGNLPVETVSWNDAAEFCAKLSQQEQLKPFYLRADETVTPLAGNGYRLPTEAEWESACRAGTTTRFWSGDEDNDLGSVAWFVDNSGVRTHAVGELRSNPFGLSDVHGNVWEWVQDSWDPAFYGKFTENAAVDPVSPFSNGSRRVLRGGIFHGNPSRCRSSDRHAASPRYLSHDKGFRVVRMVDAVKERPRVPPAPPTSKSPSAPRNFELSFDGKDDYVEIPNPPEWRDGPLTLEATVRTELVGEQLPAVLQLAGLKVRMFRPGFQWMFIAYGPAERTLLIGEPQVPLQQKLEELDQNLHIAAVYDQSSISLFINGQLRARDPVPDDFTIRAVSEKGYIGTSSVSAADSFFAGEIDEVRISDTVRYTDDYTPRGRLEDDEHTLALYHFDEGQGDRLIDSSGNGHHGTVIGAKWVSRNSRVIGDREFFQKIQELGVTTVFYYKPGSFKFPEAVLAASTATADQRLLTDVRKLTTEPDLIRAPLVFFRVKDANFGDEELKTLVELFKRRPTDALPVSLHLSVSNVTVDGLAQLQGIGLHHLEFNVTKSRIEIGASLLEVLKQLDLQSSLGIWHANLTDQFLKELSTLSYWPDMEKIILNGNAITDDGLDHLKGCTKLLKLYVRSTKVTEKGIQKLQNTLPSCRIFWDEETTEPEPATVPEAPLKAPTPPKGSADE